MSPSVATIAIPITILSRKALYFILFPLASSKDTAVCGGSAASPTDRIGSLCPSLSENIFFFFLHCLYQTLDKEHGLLAKLMK